MKGCLYWMSSESSYGFLIIYDYVVDCMKWWILGDSHWCFLAAERLQKLSWTSRCPPKTWWREIVCWPCPVAHALDPCACSRQNAWNRCPVTCFNGNLFQQMPSGSLSLPKLARFRLTNHQLSSYGSQVLGLHNREGGIAVVRFAPPQSFEGSETSLLEAKVPSKKPSLKGFSLG